MFCLQMYCWSCLALRNDFYVLYKHHMLLSVKDSHIKLAYKMETLSTQEKLIILEAHRSLSKGPSKKKTQLCIKLRFNRSLCIGTKNGKQ